jgi:hypothetical protein
LELVGDMDNSPVYPGLPQIETHDEVRLSPVSVDESRQMRVKSMQKDDYIDNVCNKIFGTATDHVVHQIPLESGTQGFATVLLLFRILLSHRHLVYLQSEVSANGTSACCVNIDCFSPFVKFVDDCIFHMTLFHCRSQVVQAFFELLLQRTMRDRH